MNVDFMLFHSPEFIFLFFPAVILHFSLAHWSAPQNRSQPP
jgi:hypothetical protein